MLIPSGGHQLLINVIVYLNVRLTIEANDDTPADCFYLFDQILVIPFPSLEKIG